MQLSLLFWVVCNCDQVYYTHLDVVFFGLATNTLNVRNNNNNNASGRDKLRKLFGSKLEEAPNITRIRLYLCLYVPTTFRYTTRSSHIIITMNQCYNWGRAASTEFAYKTY